MRIAIVGAVLALSSLALADSMSGYQMTECKGSICVKISSPNAALSKGRQITNLDKTTLEIFDAHSNTLTAKYTGTKAYIDHELGLLVFTHLSHPEGNKGLLFDLNKGLVKEL